MTKEEILAAAGYPNTPDGIAAFYNEYDTPEAFFAKHGGSLSGAPHNGQPTADQFFNYGSHANDKLNIPMSNPFFLEEGGAYYGGPTYPMEYGGDITEFCWGGGLPGGPNEMPEMLHGGYHSPMNYGSFPAIEWGGALDASNQDAFPMMEEGGLKQFIKSVSKARKKAYKEGGKTTIQGGNQDFLSQRNNTFSSFIKDNVYNDMLKKEEQAAMQAMNPYANYMPEEEQYQAKKGKQKGSDDVPIDYRKALPELFPVGRDYGFANSSYHMTKDDYIKMQDLAKRMQDKQFNLTGFKGTPEYGALARLLGSRGQRWFGPKAVTYEFTGRGVKQVPVKDTDLNLPAFEKNRQALPADASALTDYFNQGTTEFEDKAGTDFRGMIEPENMKMRKGQMPDGLKESSYMRSLMLKKNPLMQEYPQDYDNNEFQDKANYSDQNIQLDPYLINNAQNMYENYMRTKQGYGSKKYGGILNRYQMAGQVTPEQYYELEKMYKAAEAANAANPGKQNEAIGAFQQKYHELYPQRAQEIIQSRGTATAKGKSLAPGQEFSLESNVDKYFGPTTKQYWQSVQAPSGAMAQPAPVVGEYPKLNEMQVDDSKIADLTFKNPQSTQPKLSSTTQPNPLKGGAGLTDINEPDTPINLTSAQSTKPTKDQILAKKAGMDMKPLQKDKPEMTGPTDTEIGPEETVKSKIKRKTDWKGLLKHSATAADFLAGQLEKKPKPSTSYEGYAVLGNRGDYDINSGDFRVHQQVPVQFGEEGPAAYRTKFGGALPQALSGLEVKMQPGLYGTNGNRQFSLPTQVDSQKYAQQPTSVRDSLSAVPRDEANLEAEGGETALVNINGIPAHFKITGKRHSQGGVPLNLPDNSFIYSDTASMKIKDPNILAQFGMAPKKGGYTPAEIAKKYDINKYRKILSNPNSEALERKTAEAMIANNNMKLAKLALAQESVKGFPQGIPVVAMPYMMTHNIDPAMYVPTQGQEEQPDDDMGVSRYGGNIVAQYSTMRYGGLPKAQSGLEAQEAKLIQAFKKAKKEGNDSLAKKINAQLNDIYIKKTMPKVQASVNNEENTEDDYKRKVLESYDYLNTKPETSFWDFAGGFKDLGKAIAAYTNTMPGYDPLLAHQNMKAVEKFSPSYLKKHPGGYLANLLQVPESGMNYALTGRFQPTENLWTGLAIDPTTYLGAREIIEGPKLLYQASKELSDDVLKYAYQYGPKVYNAAKELAKKGYTLSKEGIEWVAKNATKGVEWLGKNFGKFLDTRAANVASSALGKSATGYTQDQEKTEELKKLKLENKVLKEEKEKGIQQISQPAKISPKAELAKKNTIANMKRAEAEYINTMGALNRFADFKQPTSYQQFASGLPQYERPIVAPPVEEEVVPVVTPKPAVKNVEVKKKPEVKAQAKSKSSSFLSDLGEYTLIDNTK